MIILGGASLVGGIATGFALWYERRIGERETSGCASCTEDDGDVATGRVRLRFSSGLVLDADAVVGVRPLAASMTRAVWTLQRPAGWPWPDKVALWSNSQGAYAQASSSLSSTPYPFYVVRSGERVALVSGAGSETRWMVANEKTVPATWGMGVPYKYGEATPENSLMYVTPDN